MQTPPFRRVVIAVHYTVELPDDDRHSATSLRIVTDSEGNLRATDHDGYLIHRGKVIKTEYIAAIEEKPE